MEGIQQKKTVGMRLATDNNKENEQRTKDEFLQDVGEVEQKKDRELSRNEETENISNKVSPCTTPRRDFAGWISRPDRKRAGYALIQQGRTKVASTKKVIHCGRATGGTVDKSSGGWTELKQFAQRREEKTNA